MRFSISFVSMLIITIFCPAQDTIVFKNGERAGVKVISVIDKVIYSIPPSDNQINISRSNIAYIKYEDGTIYTINSADIAASHSKYTISFAIGAGIPGDDTHYLSEQDLVDRETGNPPTGGYSCGNSYAEPGISANVDFGYALQNQKIVLTCSAGYNHNPFDIDNYANLLFLDQQETLTNTHATDYDIFTFLPGFKYPFLKGKFAFYFQFSMGLLICRSPYISYTEYSTTGYLNSPENIVITPGTGTSFAFNLGVDFEYHISNTTFIKFNADFFKTSTVIQVSVTNSPSLSQLYSSTTPQITIPIAVSNLKLGIGYEF